MRLVTPSSIMSVMQPSVDAVVVTYNSAETIRACVVSLLRDRSTAVWVVDNCSSDGTVGSIEGLPVIPLPQSENRGFASGCNIGARHGRAPYVLLLNPDAVISAGGVAALVDVLDRDDEVGLCAPKILEADGSLEHSQRHFPRLRTTFAQAFFAHRVLPNAPWADELVRSPAAYTEAGSPDWVSGACMLIRRSVLEELGGLDEGFFLYGEDIDLCRRVRQAGWDIRFVPTATVTHLGGASGSRPRLRPLLVASRIRYLEKHAGLVTRVLARCGIALRELTHMAISSRGLSGRLGHARALGLALRREDDMVAIAQRALGS